MVGGDRIDDTSVHKAIREALANCLVNADYYQPRGVVVIRSIETLDISNPGGFRIPIETALSGGVSDPRNATLLKMFNLIDVGERTGSGIPLIRETWRQMNWPEISAKEEVGPERTVVRLQLPSSVQPAGGGKQPPSARLGERLGEKLGEKLGERRKRILAMMVKNPMVTTFELMAGIGISQTAIENNITWLRSHGYIRRIGPDKGGHWEVVRSSAN